jgi:hypothetical protein
MPKFSELQQVVQVAELPYAETYTFDGAWANYAMADNTRSWMPPGSKQGTYPHATINGSRWDNKQRLVEFHVTKPFGGIAGNCAHYYFSVDFNGNVAITNTDASRVGQQYQAQVANAASDVTRFAGAFIKAAFQKPDKTDADGWSKA